MVTTGFSFITLPEHIWADQDPLTFTNYDPDQGWPVFSGPYTLLSTSDNEFVFQRDDDWWGVAVGFKDLRAPIATCEATRAGGCLVRILAPKAQTAFYSDLRDSAFRGEGCRCCDAGMIWIFSQVGYFFTNPSFSSVTLNAVVATSRSHLVNATPSY